LISQDKPQLTCVKGPLENCTTVDETYFAGFDPTDASSAWNTQQHGL
jgi:hypothetical protein